MIRLLRAALAQRLAIYTIVIVLTIAGAFVAAILPVSLYPPLEFSRINVRAENSDLAPSLVQASLTRPLSRELATIPYASFDPRQLSGTLALQKVSTVIGALQARLPIGTAVHVQQITSNLFPVVTYALTSTKLSAVQLREAAEFTIKPQLTGLSGIAAVNVLGGDVREYLVALDPLRMGAHSVTIDDVATAITKTNAIASVGHADADYVRSTILASGMARSLDDVARMPVASRDGSVLTVGTVATVSEAAGPRFVTATSAGRSAVLLNIFPQPGSSYVSVSRTVEAAMRTVVPSAGDIHVSKFWDLSTLVADAIENLRDAILVGLVLSILVLFFFLRNWRATLIAGVVIPLTIVISFVFMFFFGQGLSLMTLGGLAVGVGLIIDDAIVVVENINRHLGRGEDRQQGVLEAVAEIAGPMTSSTITTIVVFAPLSLLSGVAGAFFQALSITLAISLVVSLVLAFLFTPNLAARFLRAEPEKRNPLVDAIERRYVPLLVASLRRRGLIFACAGLILATTFLIGRSLGSDFLPTLDEGAFEHTFTLPPGTTLAETERVERQIEGIIDDDPATARSAGIIGASLTLVNTDTPAGVNGGTLRITLEPKVSLLSFFPSDPRRRVGIRTIMDRIGDRIASAAPKAQFSNRQLIQDSLNDLSNQAAPIEIRLFGPEQSLLVPLATQLANRISGVPGVAGVFSGVTYHNPSIVVRADPAASALGVSAGQLAEDEATIFGGRIVSQVIANPLIIPIRLRYDIPLDPSPASLASLPYVTPTGNVVPLGRLVTFTTSPPQSDISEINGRQYIAITAQIDGSNLGEIVEKLRKEIDKIRLPSGYSYAIAGSYELQQESFRQFALAIGLSVALVFLVMVVQFRSLLQPIAILCAVPLSGFGAVVILWLTHVTLNVSSLMGVILLVGLVVKNGILLLEYAAKNERAGEALHVALVNAARVRLRPILMTTLTALLGMVPLAFAIGSGSELLQPLAIVVIGGLSFSTLFTLVLVPVIFTVLVDVGRRSTRERLLVRTIFVSVAAIAMCPVMLGASSAPLTLTDAIASATRLSTGEASIALSEATKMANRVRRQPRTSVVSTLVSQPQSGTSPQYQASIEYTIDVGSSPRRLGALQATQAQLVQAGASLAQIERATVRSIIVAFFGVASAQADVGMGAENLALAQRTLSVAKVRSTQGVAPLLDVDRANAALAVATATLDSAHASLEGARGVLRRFVPSFGTAASIAVPVRTDPVPDPNTVVASALASDVNVATAAATLRSAQVAALFVKAETSPGLTVGIGPGISRTGNAQSIGPAATIALDIPLSSAFMRSNLIASDAAVLVARAGVDASRAEAAQVALQARSAAMSALARIPNLDRALRATRHVAEADLAGYRIGALSSSEVLAAQSQVASSRAAFIAATLSAAEARAILDLQMGVLDT
jgi:CzcA family heavy metal efflux pump